MPAALATDKPDDRRSEQMFKALKAHILRERERKKQEREAEVEEERQRKEREAREQQNEMTLGETREQIAQLELKLTQLKDEKHQLFLQLKKVLNEDDNRRRQLGKESDIVTIQALPPNMVQQQLYVQQQPRAPIVQQAFKSVAKRPRSPSPQPAVSLYHQVYNYKPPTVNTGYQNSPQKDDGRRHELVRAVLWNKTPQYANQPGAFYPVPPQDISIYYQQPMASREPPPPPRGVYESPRPPQAYHMEAKPPPPPLEHYGLRAPPGGSHVIHGAAIPLNPAQPSKSGSITAGYPVRSQPQYQQQQQPPAGMYTAQSRPLYPGAPPPPPGAGPPLSYGQRE